MKSRLTISSEQWRQIDAASALLRASQRDQFKRDVIRHLELSCCGLTAASNERVSAAINATIGVTQTQIFLQDAAPTINNRRAKLVLGRPVIGERSMSKTHRHDIDDDDDKRIVPDGGRVVVRMAMMDAMQKEIRQASTRITDGSGSELGLHRPGYRIESGGGANDAFIRDQEAKERRSVYDEYDKLKSQEYLQDITGAAIGKQEGDSCTVRGSRDRGVFGSRGTLQYVEGEDDLVCVADDRGSTDAKTAARDAYEEDLVNQWRNGK
jgi:hypothetical protein